MIQQYSNFFVDAYQKSGGYLPSWPFLSSVQLGDLLLFQRGRIIKVGNFLDKYFEIYQDVKMEEDWQPYIDSWFLQSGVLQSYTSNSGNDDLSISHEPLGLKLVFDLPGDYIFHASELRTRSIENFYEFKFKLLQDLAAEKFSFTEIFVVTSLAKVDSFSLLIAGNTQANAVIEIEEDQQSYYTFQDLANIESKAKVACMESISSTYIKKTGGASFFKAQKLEPSPKGKSIINAYSKENLPQSMQKYIKNILRFAPTQLLPAIDVFPAKVHELFHFREMNMDDVLYFLGEDQ